MDKNNYSFLEAKQAIEAWCAYRDRCHSETTKKLKGYGLSEEDINALLSHLIEYDFLNEQRFADSFVSGKFRMKKWGRIKIRHHLRVKNIPTKCIDEAFQEIDENEYLSQLRTLAQKKWKEKSGNNFEKKVKVQRYLLNKGYEQSLIYSCLEDF